MDFIRVVFAQIFCIIMNLLNNKTAHLPCPTTYVKRQSTTAPQLANIHRSRVWGIMLVWRVWMLQRLRPPPQLLPLAHNGLYHSVNLLLSCLSLQDDGGWEYEGTQTFLIDEAADQILESSLTPARAVREYFIPSIHLTNTISRKGLTNSYKNRTAWPDKSDAGNILHNNFHLGIAVAAWDEMFGDMAAGGVPFRSYSKICCTIHIGQV